MRCPVLVDIRRWEADGTGRMRARPSPLLPVRAQFPGLHAEETGKVALHLDAGRQRAPPDGHFGDLAVGVEQDVVHSVDRGVFDLQPEVRGVVRLAAEDFLVGEVGRTRRPLAWLPGLPARPVGGSSPSGLYITTSSARMPERASLSAPPCMASTKDSTVSRCGANVVMMTPMCFVAWFVRCSSQITVVPPSTTSSMPLT